MRFLCTGRMNRSPSLPFVLPLGDKPCGKCLSHDFEPQTVLEVDTKPRRDWFGDWDAPHGPARHIPSKPSSLVLWSPNWKTESLTLSAISGDIEDNLSEWSSSLAKSGSERLFVLPPTTKDLLHRPQLADLEEETQSTSSISRHPSDPLPDSPYSVVKKLNKQLAQPGQPRPSAAKSTVSQVTRTTLEPIVESRGTPDSVSVSEATQQTTIIENHPSLLGTVQATLADKVIKNKFEENLNKCLEQSLKKSASSSTLASYKREQNKSAKESVKANSASPQLVKREFAVPEENTSEEDSPKRAKKDLKRRNSLVKQLSKMLQKILPQRHKNEDLTLMDEKRIKHQLKTNSLPATPLSHRKPPKKADMNGSVKIKNAAGERHLIFLRLLINGAFGSFSWDFKRQKISVKLRHSNETSLINPT
ncbi:unnamed protein product [Bursaphelenchus okinawaensis]|uniref:Uncharacterized protein n=1 Tax=Bursaphelenchus okinawaensis TaxID=465554 RepID=A0A811KKI7_9BILA|nr:unnamed protein product [Bursaphelenchus okinawaensis]CAG9105629.1 unnamed protein product [Bursaphelenchus okinawaensis]